MSTLHTLSRSPNSGLLADCLKTLGKGDSILFIEDGVYHCLQAEYLQPIPERVKLFALREDLQARGLVDRLPDAVDSVNTKRFVSLCCDHDKVMNWF